MDIKQLVRDPEKVKSVLVELPDGRLTTKALVKIYIPTRFAERDLAYIGADNNIVGICAITLNDDSYAIMMVNAMVNIDPSSINRVSIEDDQYFEFTFNPGATVFKSVNLIKDDILVYKIYDEIISNGNVPWYLTYSDLGKIFDTAPYHGGANIGNNKEVTELIVSLIARDQADRTKYYRTALNSMADLKKSEPVYVGLKSVVYSATNTLNRLGGSYMQSGITASLVNKTERVERIESILCR